MSPLLYFKNIARALRYNNTDYFVFLGEGLYKVPCVINSLSGVGVDYSVEVMRLTLHCCGEGLL
jgi:hypothetical protein